MVTCRGKPSLSVHVNTNVYPGAVGHGEEFDPALVHRVKMEEKVFMDRESVMSFRDPMLRRKDVVSFAPGGSQSTRDPMTLFSCVPGGSLKNSVVVAVTSTSTSQRRVALR